MNQLKKGAILSYINIFLVNTLSMVITPLIIRNLGAAEYGLYAMIGAMVGYMSVMDFGLNNTIIRFVSKYRAKGDKTGEENFLASSMIIYTVISTIIVIAGMVVYYNFDQVFSKSLSDVELVKAKLMFLILIFNLAISLPGGSFDAICSAYEQFVYPRTITIIRYLVRSVLVVAILIAGSDAVGIVLLDTLINIIVISLNMRFVFRTLGVKFRLHSISRKLIKEVISYSIWIFVFAVVIELQWKFGQVIIGLYQSTEMVAIYAVGIMLGTYYGSFSTAVVGVFIPRAMQMTVRNVSSEELTSMMSKIGRIVFLVLLLLFGGFALFGKEFIVLWIGEKYSDAWGIALIIMAAYTLPLVQGFGNLLLEAKRLFSFKAKIYFIFISLGLASGVVLLNKYGLLGMVSGTTIGWVMSLIIMNVYYNNVLKLNMKRFFIELTSRIAPSFMIIMIIGYYINMIAGEGWKIFIIKGILFTMVYISVMLKFGLNTSEREMVNGFKLKGLVWSK